MATVASPADQAADLLQKLSLDGQPKAFEIPEPHNKANGNEFGSVDSGNVTNGQNTSNERSVTPLSQDFIDPSMCYLPNGYPSAYYYGGFDVTGHEWDDYSRYVHTDGVEMTSGVYEDNGSLLYHHGYGFGYAPYGPYSPAGSPVPSMVNDGQLYGPQHYQYPPYFQPLTQTSGPFTPIPAVPPQGEVITPSGAADLKTLPVEAAKGSCNSVTNGASAKGNIGAAPVKPPYQSTPFNSNALYGRDGVPRHIPTSGYQDMRIGFDGMRSPISLVDAPAFCDGPRAVTSTTITSSLSGGNNITPSRNQTYCPNSQFMGLHHPRPMPATHGFLSRMSSNKLYAQYGNTVRSGMGCGRANDYDSRSNGQRTWLAVDKYKTRGRSGGYFGYGSENIDGLNELNRGPRAKGGKSLRGLTPTVRGVKGQNSPPNLINDEEKDKPSVVPNDEQYNKADFPAEYADAKFFIIKSYSEDDIHKSIKYSVWASTQNGNKKLDAAYLEAQQKPGGCPVFLFFSVNTSGQFVGIAEMIGPVDFNRSVDYWQQDKWNGCFPLQWHIVKDVPNNLLRHITLDNNENKPVTNSRDTQEVMLEPGLKMIKIFKEYSSKTCILDDFGFYETRQMTILEKKAKEQFLKQQVWEGKPINEKMEVNGEVTVQKSDVTFDLLKESSVTENDNNDLKISDNGSVIKTGDAPKGAKLVVSEGKVLANGVANGC